MHLKLKYILFLISYTYSVFADKNIREKTNELILCRKCGADVADSNYIFAKQSPGSSKTEKRHIFGKQNITVQTLVNPFGVKFDVVTTEKARCENVGQQQGADSWFPGYTWKICICPFCGQHLGWTFELSKQSDKSKKDDIFHGLILGNILGENFTDSLIVMPNMYNM